VNVAVLGAAGGIGQPLSLLLKMSPSIGSLRLYDISKAVPGIAADLSHIPTSATVTAHVGKESLQATLTNADIVVIPAGVPRKPGMTRDDLFNTNAGIIRDLAEAAAAYSPKAFILVITNPVNSTVPIVAETFKKAGTYDKRRLFGVTTLDALRASTFTAEIRPTDFTPEKLHVPVIGGHSGITILPLLSHLKPKKAFEASEITALTTRIQTGGDEVVKAKDGAGSATLSMAAAAQQFTLECVQALQGKQVTTTAYIESDVVSGVAYFASEFSLGKDGVVSVSKLAQLSEFEKQALEKVIPELNKNIDAGVNFAKK